MDLYTFGTPNGHKISILLEELGVPYNVKKIDIMKGDQKAPEYLKVNPNGRIPALVDDGVRIFESIAIMIYLAEKYKKFLPNEGAARYETLAWTMFQAAGVGPMFGQYGHFKNYAPEKIPYAMDRYRNEANRLMSVLNTQLETNTYLAGDEYSIADMATYPWIRGFRVFYKEPLDEQAYPHLARWYALIDQRPAVQRGLKVPA